MGYAALKTALEAANSYYDPELCGSGPSGQQKEIYHIWKMGERKLQQKVIFIIITQRQPKTD